MLRKEIKMQKKIKLIISFVLLIIGIILIVLAITKFNNNLNNKPGKDNDAEIVYEFSNFLINNSNADEINLSLDIKNNSENILNENKMYLKFYQKKDILYTYEYDIPKLNSYDTISLGVTLNFEYDNITKYEIVIGNLTKEITPIIITD